MSDHLEHACTFCGSYICHEICASAWQHKLWEALEQRDEWADAIRTVAPGSIPSPHAAKHAILDLKDRYEKALQELDELRRYRDEWERLPSTVRIRELEDLVEKENDRANTNACLLAKADAVVKAVQRVSDVRALSGNEYSVMDEINALDARDRAVRLYEEARKHAHDDKDPGSSSELPSVRDASRATVQPEQRNESPQDEAGSGASRGKFFGVGAAHSDVLHGDVTPEDASSAHTKKFSEAFDHARDVVSYKLSSLDDALEKVRASVSYRCCECRGTGCNVCENVGWIKCNKDDDKPATKGDILNVRSALNVLEARLEALEKRELELAYAKSRKTLIDRF